MHCTQYHTIRTRLLHTVAVAALSVVGLLPLPAANAQMNPPQASPQAQSPQSQVPQTQPPSAPISDEKLNAAAAAIRQVTTIHQSYESKIAAAAPSDKQRLTIEANDAMAKAVTDQGLSVDEYNSIISAAHNDPAVREKLTQRMRRSAQ